MSVWSNCSGSISIPKDSGVSIRTLIKDVFDEVRIGTCEQQYDFTRVSVKFDFAFCMEGIAAAKLVQQFVDQLRAIQWSANAEVSADIRF